MEGRMKGPGVKSQGAHIYIGGEKALNEGKDYVSC